MTKKAKNDRNGSKGAAIPPLADLRQLSWEEIYRQFHNPVYEGKLALLRQAAENYWQGQYKNHQKQEVERFLCTFINKNDKLHKANMSCLLGYGYIAEAFRQKLIRDAILIIFVFLSRSSKLNGAIQGLIDTIRRNPPDDRFLREAEVAVHASHL